MAGEIGDVAMHRHGPPPAAVDRQGSGDGVVGGRALVDHDVEPAPRQGHRLARPMPPAGAR